MRAWLTVALLLSVTLSGCTSVFGDDDEREVGPVDVGYDPADVRVTGVTRDAFGLSSWDGTTLDTVIYSPISGDILPDGSSPEWPVVVMLHGWGIFKEQFEGTEAANENLSPPGGTTPKEFTNTLEEFARAGFIAVAYDARGQGRSSGVSTMAGPAEEADLQAVLDYINNNYDASDRVGVVGTSYGGGQALLALARNSNVDTAVSMYGWYDLYDGLMPNNVPKGEWLALLAGEGAVAGKGRLHPDMQAWSAAAVSRVGLADVQAEMDSRSIRDELPTVTKPMFACQGINEGLFPQVDQLLENAGGFARAYIYDGGHTTSDPVCWEKTLDWFSFFLAGVDTEVDQWPVLETVDIMGNDAIAYQEMPATALTTWYLRGDIMSRDPSPNVTHSVSQQIASNPLQEPSVASDVTGQNPVPEGFRNDPSALFFETAPLSDPAIYFGAGEISLQLVDENLTGYQVVATLYHVDAGGSSIVLSRNAYAIPTDMEATSTIDIRLPYSKVDLDAGDKLVVKIGGNDPSWYLPMTTNYEVEFTGASSFSAPFVVA